MMRKTIIGIVGFFALLLASSGFTQRSAAPAVGYMAPALLVDNDKTDESVSLTALRGSYVLLTFWNSTQANSRLAMNRYQHWVDSRQTTYDDKEVAIVGVNLDSDKRMFEELVKRDHLDPSNQFNISGEKASLVIENYQLEDQAKSFLIDPDGRIVAINPTSSQLNEI